MEDEQIIELYFSRNQNAVDETNAKYGNYLKKITMNILENSQDCEECLNDTYMKVWNVIPPQRPSNFKLWIAKIAKNISLDIYKKSHREKRGGDNIDLILSELEQCIPSISLEKEYENTQITVLINNFLLSQEEWNSTFFVRRYWHCESIKTIANSLNVSESRVKSSLFRTRKLLYSYLEKESVDI